MKNKIIMTLLIALMAIGTTSYATPDWHHHHRDHHSMHHHHDRRMR